eukprot:UN34655
MTYQENQIISLGHYFGCPIKFTFEDLKFVDKGGYAHVFKLRLTREEVHAPKFIAVRLIHGKGIKRKNPGYNAAVASKYVINASLELTPVNIVVESYSYYLGQAMEFCEHGDLFSLEFRNDQQLLFFIYEISDALGTMHDAGYVHQD